MNKLLKFNEAVSNDNTYIEIIEKNDNEGEIWTFFVKKKGNEEFISKLKKAISKYDDEDNENGLIIGDQNVPESDVNVLVKRGNKHSGYMFLFNKRDGKLDPDRIDDTDEETYMQSFYKGGLFR